MTQRIAFSILVPALLVTVAASAAPSVLQPLGRQAIYLAPILDGLDGNLMMRVNNPRQEPMRDTLQLMLPLQTVSWEPLAGFTREDSKVNRSETGWIIERQFSPGLTPLAAAFRLEAFFGKAHVTIPIAYPVGQLALFAKPSLLTFEDYPSFCRVETDSAFMGMTFDILSCASPPVGQDLSFTIHNLPEGRLRYLLLGGIFGFLLFLSGFAIAWVGRPRLHEEI